MVPLSPVTVKDTVVDVADWFVAIVTLDICALVTFPQIARSTVAPLSVVAGTVVAEGVADGVGVGDGAVLFPCWGHGYLGISQYLLFN